MSWFIAGFVGLNHLILFPENLFLVIAGAKRFFKLLVRTENSIRFDTYVKCSFNHANREVLISYLIILLLRRVACYTRVLNISIEEIKTAPNVK